MTSRFLKLFVSLCAIFFSVIFFSSCKKEPGDGGLATIKGKVFSYKLDQQYAVDSNYRSDERVYLSYGDHTWIDDDTRTSYTGEYIFQWLQPGDYKVWVLSDCNVCPPERQMDIIDVTINKRKETIELRDLIHYRD